MAYVQLHAAPWDTHEPDAKPVLSEQAMSQTVGVLSYQQDDDKGGAEPLAAGLLMLLSDKQTGPDPACNTAVALLKSLVLNKQKACIKHVLVCCSRNSA